MQSSIFGSVVLCFLGFLLCSLSANSEECLLEESQDEVSLLQVGQADVQSRKTGHPVLQTEDSTQGWYLLAQGDPDPVETARELIMKEENSTHSAHGDIFSDNGGDSDADNLDRNPVYVLLKGILNTAHEKIHAASRFVATQAKDMASRLQSSHDPLSKDAKLVKKSKELVHYLEEWLLFVMYALMVVFIIAFIIFTIIACGLLISWRVQVFDEQYQRERAAEDAASAPPRQVERVPQTGVHHRPFQGESRRLSPDDKEEK